MRTPSFRPSGPSPQTIPAFLATFNGLEANSVVAGQLTGLMLKEDPVAEMGVVLNNIAGEDDEGNQIFDVKERWAMFKLYTVINALRTRAAVHLQDLLPQDVVRTTHQELIRALFKGQIPLDGMTVEGFVEETKRLADKIFRGSTAHSEASL